MESSSTPSVPINVESRDSIQVKPRSLVFKRDDPKLIIKQVVDFDSFASNEYKLKEYFETQGWVNYFNSLNGPTYSFFVRYFLG